MARKRKLPMVKDSRKTATWLGIEAKQEGRRGEFSRMTPLTQEQKQQLRAKLPTSDPVIFQSARSGSGKARAQAKNSRRINKR